MLVLAKSHALEQNNVAELDCYSLPGYAHRHSGMPNIHSTDTVNKSRHRVTVANDPVKGKGKGKGKVKSRK